MGSYRGTLGERRASAGGRTLGALALFVALMIAAMLLTAAGAAGPAQSLGQRVFAPATAALRSATAPMADFFANVGSYGRLRDENRALLVENERLSVELARVREDENRARELADLLNIGAQFGSDRVTFAAIIAHDPNPMRHVVAINRGTRDGVETGMTVLGKGGALVGTVERALDSVAWVKLLTDSRSGVNAIIQESRALALAAGSADRVVRMEFVTRDVVVKPGDTVLTSGLGGGYPAGLLIGRVSRVEGGPSDAAQRVQVEPAVRFASLESVAVLTGFVPVPVEGLTR